MKKLMKDCLIVAVSFGAWFFITYSENAEANTVYECSQQNIDREMGVLTHIQSQRHRSKPLTAEELDLFKYYATGLGKLTLEQDRLMWTAHTAKVYMTESNQQRVIVLLYHRECMIQGHILDAKLFHEIIAGFYKT